MEKFIFVQCDKGNKLFVLFILCAKNVFLKLCEYMCTFNIAKGCQTECLQN